LCRLRFLANLRKATARSPRGTTAGRHGGRDSCPGAGPAVLLLSRRLVLPAWVLPAAQPRAELGGTSRTKQPYKGPPGRWTRQPAATPPPALPLVSLRAQAAGFASPQAEANSISPQAVSPAAWLCPSAAVIPVGRCYPIIKTDGLLGGEQNCCTRDVNAARDTGK